MKPAKQFQVVIKMVPHPQSYGNRVTVVAVTAPAVTVRVHQTRLRQDWSANP